MCPVNAYYLCPPVNAVCPFLLLNNHIIHVLSHDANCPFKWGMHLEEDLGPFWIRFSESVQIICDSPSTIGRHFTGWTISYPTMDSSTTRVDPQKVFVTEVLCTGETQIFTDYHEICAIDLIHRFYDCLTTNIDRMCNAQLTLSLTVTILRVGKVNVLVIISALPVRAAWRHRIAIVMKGQHRGQMSAAEQHERTSSKSVISISRTYSRSQGFLSCLSFCNWIPNGRLILDYFR